MREYNVILKKDIDYDGFWNDMESDTDGGKLYIPNRRVEFTNERPASLRQCWYLLTDEEAEQLKLDERVFDVEIPPEYRTDIIIGTRPTQYSDFTKTTSDSGAYVNWGLLRCSLPTNRYESGTGQPINTYYNYSLDGTNVDVVIQDSGIEVNHPEFQDALGNNRIQQINWATVSGLAFTQNANHYRDYDGHGTHVAGIACGKTYGWAKNAKIYAQKLSGLEGTGDSGTGISTTYAFDAIKIWHRDKGIDSTLGCKRPTVVNMSWGYLQPYDSVLSITYRGNTFLTGSAVLDEFWRSTNAGLPIIDGSSFGYNFVTNVRVSSTDTDIEEMIDAGIIICIAAGNRSHKIDISGGADYDNNIVPDSGSEGTIYYHRGSSPYSTRAFIVGSLDYDTYDNTFDQKATYSETGPGVNIWAPGTSIMSCTSTTNKWGAGSQNYYLNASYKQTNISGTSMASPQVAGVAALFLQANPTASVTQVLTSLQRKSTPLIYTGSNSSSYTDFRALHGSSNRHLFSPFSSSPSALTFSGSFSISANIKFT